MDLCHDYPDMLYNDEESIPVLDADYDVVEFPIADSQKQECAIMDIIVDTTADSKPVLNLSGMRLLRMPETLMNLDFLGVLYVDVGSITHFPHTFWKRLPNLRWVDARHNCLKDLPTLGLAQLSRLKGLLISHNDIRRLPTELGRIMSLSTLECHGNPLKFPPMDVSLFNTKKLLEFLRRAHDVGGKADSFADTPKKSMARRPKKTFGAVGAPLPPIMAAAQPSQDRNRCKREDEAPQPEEVFDFDTWFCRKNKLEEWFTKAKDRDEMSEDSISYTKIPEIYEKPPYGIDEALVKIIMEEERKKVDVFTTKDRPINKPCATSGREELLRLKLWQMYRIEKDIRNKTACRTRRRKNSRLDAVDEQKAAMEETLELRLAHMELAKIRLELETI